MEENITWTQPEDEYLRQVALGVLAETHLIQYETLKKPDPILDLPQHSMVWLGFGLYCLYVILSVVTGVKWCILIGFFILFLCLLLSYAKMKFQIKSLDALLSEEVSVAEVTSDCISFYNGGWFKESYWRATVYTSRFPMNRKYYDFAGFSPSSEDRKMLLVRNDAFVRAIPYDDKVFDEYVKMFKREGVDSAI